MTLPLALALLLAPAQEPDPASANPTVDFSAPQLVAEPNRLALTPVLDGKRKIEEWDEFASVSEGDSYLQWEPGMLYVAATAPLSRDVVISLDLKGDGWLVGNDNIEVRVGATTASARRLDATNVAGPTWMEMPGLAMATKFARGATEEKEFVEVAIQDPGLGLLPTATKSKVSVRVDAVPADMPPAVALTPRVLSAVVLVSERAAAAPDALRWGTEASGRIVLPGDTTRMRFTFEGNPNVQPSKLEMRSEGLARDSTYEVTVPFPPFDRRGRAYVDYNTQVTPDASLGYRILRGTLQTSDGIPAILQMSYRIAPIVDVELVRVPIRVSPRDQTFRLAYYVTSNSTRRLNGNMEIRLPQEIRGIAGEEKKFVIYNSRGRIRNILEVQIPAGTTGVHPIVFNATVGDKTVEHTAYLNIGP